MNLGKISLVSFDPPPGAFYTGEPNEPAGQVIGKYFLVYAIIAAIVGVLLLLSKFVPDEVSVQTKPASSVEMKQK